ncbi:beta-glucoside-specific PTS transporter subunit IIABC [Allobaculum stercoricanis]|uniref:beta-glucoside-specific PTS transporter subunit IIABC n=1 Tax=Allobaculum stercoricanis TaxID=174709 RepID=UPI0003808036|nr:beta-glucoside-specific PTS transporter subunit IIABC [Allobaculum stercoricanis]
MNYNELGAVILDLVGGKDNVTGLTHCATRLRFNLKNEGLAKTDQIKETPGVLGVVSKGGQYQIIIGNDVSHVFRPIMDVVKLEEFNSALKSEEKKGLGSKFIDTITGIFTPILPAITAAGMIKAVLSICTAFGWLQTTDSTYQVINFMADAAFYFLPVLLANSAAKKFNTNPYLAMMIGGILLHPNFVSMVTASKETGEAIRLFGLPVYNASYSSSVIPIILAVWFMSYVEPIADRISPKAIKFFTKPLITILVSGTVTLLAIGPVGFIISSWISNGINLLNSYASWLVPTLLGGLFPIFVMTGTHYGIIPIGINNRMTMGYDTLVYPANLCSNIAQGAATFAVAVKTKQENIRELAYSTGITAVCGITEPALFGVNIRFKTPLIAACIGGAFGGLYTGLMGVRNFAGGSPGLMTLAGYIGDDTFRHLIHASIGATIAFVIAFIVSYILYKEKNNDGTESKGKQEEGKQDQKENQDRLSLGGIKICSPVQGTLVDLKDVNDPTFAQEILGKGAAIIPEDNTFYSPIEGEVVMVFNTEHAIGLKSKDGAEILIHVGLDTVNLNGEHYHALVKAGDKVRVGDPILEVELEAIKEKGYDLVTPILVTNSNDFQDIAATNDGSVNPGDQIILAFH